MRYILENDYMKVEIDSFGAELKSVKSKANDFDYMWCGDKKYWGRTSPVLFPFVGSLKNKEFTVDDKRYPMGQHGFARDMEHTPVSHSKDSVWFELKSNDKTIAKYPFEFILKIGYELTDNSVKVIWEVENPSSNALPFSIGAHPAFVCPITGDSKEGYSISFGKFENEPGNSSLNTVIDAAAKIADVNEIHHHGNTRDSGLALDEDIVLELNEGKCSITEGFFDRCTYMIENNQANKVGLVNPQGHEYITVLFDTPLFAVWSPEEKNAPFVCIEPWYGRCDRVDFEGDITDREYTNVINDEHFHAEYVMIFN